MVVLCQAVKTYPPQTQGTAALRLRVYVYIIHLFLLILITGYGAPPVGTGPVGRKEGGQKKLLFNVRSCQVCATGSVPESKFIQDLRSVVPTYSLMV